MRYSSSSEWHLGAREKKSRMRLNNVTWMEMMYGQNDNVLHLYVMSSSSSASAVESQSGPFYLHTYLQCEASIIHPSLSSVCPMKKGRYKRISSLPLSRQREREREWGGISHFAYFRDIYRPKKRSFSSWKEGEDRALAPFTFSSGHLSFDETCEQEQEKYRWKSPHFAGKRTTAKARPTYLPTYLLLEEEG